MRTHGKTARLFSACFDPWHVLTPTGIGRGEGGKKPSFNREGPSTDVAQNYTLRFLITESVELDSSLDSMSQERSDIASKVVVVFETYVQCCLLCPLGEAALAEICCRYTSKETAKQHEEEPWFKTTTDAFLGENLMAEPPYIVSTVSRAGFDLDRKLVGEF